MSTALTVVCIAVPLVVAATPFLHAHDQQPDARFLPAGAESRRLYETLEARFDPAVWVEPVVVVADAGADEAGMATFAGRVAGLDGVRSVGEPRPLGGGVQVLEVLPLGSGTDPTAARLVDAVRSLPAPFPVQVTGDAAELADYQAVIADRLPLAAGLVVLATFALLFLFTGSALGPDRDLGGGAAGGGVRRVHGRRHADHQADRAGRAVRVSAPAQAFSR